MGFCVADPEIENVIDLRSGEVLTAQAAIGGDFAAVEQLRMQLAEANAEGTPVYTCALCGVRVYLVCLRKGADKRFFFRHSLEDERCPAVTREPLTKAQIEARKYNGLRESARHLRMKEILAESLACDPDFSDVEIEPVLKGENGASRRIPDVHAVWRGRIPVAFEAQLSTTFLHVIAERRLFYLQRGGLLFWVFDRFETDAPRIMQDDIFYNNNRNIFLASERTLAASREARALVLDCRWTVPVLGINGVNEAWNNRDVRFSELTLDLERQRAFFFDADREQPQLTAQLAANDLRERFATWWDSWDEPLWRERWGDFKAELARRGLALPPLDKAGAVRGLLTALYSARAGRPVGCGHRKLISVAHTTADLYKPAMQAFRAALVVYERIAQLKREDREGNFADKARYYKERMREADPAYQRNRAYDPLVAFLFPEVMERLREWDAERNPSEQPSASVPSPLSGLTGSA